MTSSNQPSTSIELVPASSLEVGDRVAYGYGFSTVVGPVRVARRGASLLVPLETGDAYYPINGSAERAAETPNCVTCGERPWGFGYCGEECAICAAQA